MFKLILVNKSTVVNKVTTDDYITENKEIEI